MEDQGVLRPTVGSRRAHSLAAQCLRALVRLRLGQDVGKASAREIVVRYELGQAVDVLEKGLNSYGRAVPPKFAMPVVLGAAIIDRDPVENGRTVAPHVTSWRHIAALIERMRIWRMRRRAFDVLLGYARTTTTSVFVSGQEADEAAMTWRDLLARSTRELDDIVYCIDAYVQYRDEIRALSLTPKLQVVAERRLETIIRKHMDLIGREMH